MLASIGGVNSYTLFAALQLISAYCLMTLDSGLSGAVINKKNLSSSQLVSANFVIILTAIAISIFIIALKHLFLIDFLQIDYLELFSLGIFLHGLQVISIAKIKKELNFELLLKINIIANLIGFITGIILLKLNFELISYIFYFLITKLISFLLIILVKKVSFNICKFKLKSFFDLFQYSFKLFLFNQQVFFSKNIDRLIIVSLLGTNAFGIYSLSLTLTVSPLIVLIGGINIYLFSKFSSLNQNNKLLKENLFMVLEALFIVFLPVSFLMLMSAEIFVLNVLGNEWIESIQLIEYFGVISLCGILVSPLGEVLKSKKMLSYLNIWAILTLVIFASVFFILLNIEKTLYGASIAYLIYQLLCVALGVVFYKKCLDISSSDWIRLVIRITPETIFLLSGYFIYLYLEGFDLILIEILYIIFLNLMYIIYLSLKRIFLFREVLKLK